jgi:hypothetical protein
MRVTNGFIFCAMSMSMVMSASAVAHTDLRAEPWGLGKTSNGLAGMTSAASTAGRALGSDVGFQGGPPVTNPSVGPATRTPKGGTVNTGPGTLASAREFLKGRWVLESFEVRLPNQPPIVLKGGGVMVYDDKGNLTMNIKADEKSSDLLRAGGVDIRDGAIVAEGRTAIDIQNHTLTYVLGKQAPLIRGPLGTDRPRHWVVDNDVLILTTKDQAGHETSVGRWRKSP